MSNCPSCSQSIKIEDFHFGTLFTCPHCQNVFFIGWDGQPEVASQEVSFSEPIAQEMTPQAMDFITPLNSLPMNEEPIIDQPIIDQPKKEDFSDVLEFANSVEDNGVITYSLTIKGIDLSHLHEQIVEALSDPKFNWQVAEIMSKIQSGTLVLESLSPAKTVVLVQRLKYLPVEIQWRQNVLTN